MLEKLLPGKLGDAWRALTLYEEAKTMDKNSIVKLVAAFLGTAVATVCAAVAISGMDVAWGTTLSSAGTAGIAAAWLYLKTPPTQSS